MENVNVTSANNLPVYYTAKLFPSYPESVRHAPHDVLMAATLLAKESLDGGCDMSAPLLAAIKPHMFGFGFFDTPAEEAVMAIAPSIREFLAKTPGITWIDPVGTVTTLDYTVNDDDFGVDNSETPAVADRPIVGPSVGIPNPGDKDHPAVVIVPDAETTVAIMRTTAHFKLEDVSLERVYPNLISRMNEQTRGVFNSILEMDPSQSEQICWALMMGKVAMKAKAFTKSQIEKAASTPKDLVIDPYDLDVMKDTVVSRIFGGEYKTFTEPGSDTRVAVVTTIGVTLSYQTSNVAFTIEENRFQLNTLTRIYKTSHSRIVDLVQNRMLAMPDDPVDGLFFKYKPKRVVVSYDKETKKKNYDKHTIEIKKSGTYMDLPFSALGKQFDFMVLAMFSKGASPSALLSIMTHNGAGRQFLQDVVNESKSIPRVKSAVTINYYKTVLHAMSSPSVKLGMVVPLKNLTNEYFKGVYASVIPSVAADKGVFNAISRLLTPYACSTLGLGMALYDFDPAFASLKWGVYTSADVAIMLSLYAYEADGLDSPTRDGKINNLAVPGTKVKYNRRYDYDETKVNYGGVTPHKLVEGYIDLSYDLRLHSITNMLLHQKRVAKGLKSGVDLFAHDHYEGRCTFAPLYHLKDKRPVALFKMFVVVFPLKKFDDNFLLKSLMAVYDLKVVMGTLSLASSVYLVGRAREFRVPNKADVAIFADNLATILYGRLALLNQYYKGVPDDVQSLLKFVHDVIDSSGYGKFLMSLDDPETFIQRFNKTTRVSKINPAVVPVAEEDVNYTHLTQPSEDDDDFGVPIQREVVPQSPEL